MNLEMDLARNEASSFGPESLRSGALLPYEGRAAMMSPDGLRAAALAVDADGWLSPNNPVLVRGAARILPLAWRTGASRAAGGAVTADEFAEFVSQLQGAGVYWAGGWRTLEEVFAHRGDSIASYATALREAGATQANVWTFSEDIGLALVWGADDDSDTVSLAFHIVPAGWVSERRVGKPVRGVDLRWSWSDVVRMHQKRVGSADA